MKIGTNGKAIKPLENSAKASTPQYLLMKNWFTELKNRRTKLDPIIGSEYFRICFEMPNTFSSKICLYGLIFAHNAIKKDIIDAPPPIQLMLLYTKHHR